MKSLILVGLVLASLAVPGCVVKRPGAPSATKQVNPIADRWENGEKEVWVEFRQDGKYITHNPPFHHEGTWELCGDQVEITSVNLGVTFKMDWRMVGDVLELGEDGKWQRWKKVTHQRN